MTTRACALVFCLIAAGCNASAPSPTTPPPPPPPTTPTVTALTISGGTTSFSVRGATAQFTAVATLSNGATEDRTATVTWQSDDSAVVTVSGGLVTAQGYGDAQIAASLGDIRGTRAVTVRLRTPDPVPGQQIPLPANIQRTIEEIAGRRLDLLAQHCPAGLKYIPNPWLNYMVDELRKLDTRWGYNGKPTKSAADNGGVPVTAAGDEIAFHFGAGADEGSPHVYLIDILENHCGDVPRLTFRVFTGEEPGRWTGAGRF